MITSLDGLVAALGGASKVGDLLGIGRTAVVNWSAREYIQNGWHMRLFLICCERQIDFDPQIFDLPPRAFDVVVRWAQAKALPQSDDRRRA